MVTAATATLSGGTSRQTSQALHDNTQIRPLVIHATDQRRTPVGLLYPPETLAALARERGVDLSPRLRDAVRERTPIVLMWSIPPSEDFGQAPRPYRVVITDPNADSSPGSPKQIEPRWIDQEAADLLLLDSQVGLQKIGAMAAFPHAAFVLGRRVIIYSVEPATGDQNRMRVTSRNGIVEWSSGTAVDKTR